MGKLLDEYRADAARRSKEIREQWTPEDEAKISAFVTELIEGKTCPHCHTPITKKYQVGRCVYAKPCGHRQYQGVVPKEERTPADQAQIDEASLWCPLEGDEE